MEDTLDMPASSKHKLGLGLIALDHGVMETMVVWKLGWGTMGLYVSWDRMFH